MIPTVLICLHIEVNCINYIIKIVYQSIYNYIQQKTLSSGLNVNNINNSFLKHSL